MINQFFGILDNFLFYFFWKGNLEFLKLLNIFFFTWNFALHVINVFNKKQRILRATFESSFDMHV